MTVQRDTTGGTQHGGNHYKGFPIQPIDYAEENKLTAKEFSVIKYVSRHRFKGGMEDLRKAFDFLKMIAKRYYGFDVVVSYHHPTDLDEMEPPITRRPDNPNEEDEGDEDEEDEIEYPDTEAGRFSRGVDEMSMDEVRNIAAAAIVACNYKGSPKTIEHLEKILRITWPSGIPRVNVMGNTLHSEY